MYTRIHASSERTRDDLGCEIEKMYYFTHMRLFIGGTFPSRSEAFRAGAARFRFPCKFLYKFQHFRIIVKITSFRILAPSEEGSRRYRGERLDNVLFEWIFWRPRPPYWYTRAWLIKIPICRTRRARARARICARVHVWLRKSPWCMQCKGHAGWIAEIDLITTNLIECKLTRSRIGAIRRSSILPRPVFEISPRSPIPLLSLRIAIGRSCGNWWNCAVMRVISPSRNCCRVWVRMRSEFEIPAYIDKRNREQGDKEATFILSYKKEWSK